MKKFLAAFLIITGIVFAVPYLLALDEEDGWGWEDEEDGWEENWDEEDYPDDSEIGDEEEEEFDFDESEDDELGNEEEEEEFDPDSDGLSYEEDEEEAAGEDDEDASGSDNELLKRYEQQFRGLNNANSETRKSSKRRSFKKIQGQQEPDSEGIPDEPFGYQENMEPGSQNGDLIENEEELYDDTLNDDPDASEYDDEEEWWNDGN